METDPLQINELKLDSECIRQPGLYYEYAEKLANAKAKLDEVLRRQDVVQADIMKKIRERPARYDVEAGEKGPTEKAIAAAVTLQKEVLEAGELVGKARHRVDICQAMVTALEHKKRSLTLLVNLHGMSYFASPRSTKEGQDSVNKNSAANTARSVGRALNDDDDND